jgi:hypothetical protein
MPKHTPTPEQREIIDAAVRTRDNLLVNALAGAAKTSRPLTTFLSSH